MSTWECVCRCEYMSVHKHVSVCEYMGVCVCRCEYVSVCKHVSVCEDMGVCVGMSM